ncbi:unnamed protein product [Boreogadus saida]
MSPLPEALAGRSPQPAMEALAGRGATQTSPLPEAFAGCLPRPAMEAGGAGKPGEPLLALVGRGIAPWARCPSQLATEAGEAGKPGGPEGGSAGGAVTVADGLWRRREPGAEGCCRGGGGGRETCLRNTSASSDAACISSTIDDRRGPNSPSGLMGHSNNCRLIGSGMPGVCCNHRFLWMKCCHLPGRCYRTGGAEAEDDAGSFRRVDCPFGQTMRVGRHGGDVMCTQGNVVHDSLLLHHALMRPVHELGRQLVFGSGAAAAEPRLHSKDSAQDPAAVPPCNWRYRPVCQTLRLRDLDECFHLGSELPGLRRSPTEVWSDGGKHRPDRVETGGRCHGNKPPDSMQLLSEPAGRGGSRGVADGVLGESKHRFAEQGQTLRSVPLFRGGLPLDLLLTLGGGGPIWVLHDDSGYFTVFPIWLMRVRKEVLSVSG